MTATDAYWIDDTLMSVPLGGGTPSTLTGSTDAVVIATDSTSIYLGAGDLLLKLPLQGGTVTTLASGGDTIAGIALDDGSVYWTAFDCVSGNPCNGEVMKVPHDGGMSVTLAAGENGPSGIAVDATSVYWADIGGGTVRRLTPK